MSELPASLPNFFASLDVLHIVGGAVLLLCIIVLLVLRFPKKQQSFSLQSEINTPDHVRVLLDEAIVQRQTFELQPTTSPDINRPTLKCTLINFTKQSFTLEAVGVTLSAHWLGKEVSISFRIQHKDRYAYYSCNTTISEIKTGEGRCQLTFPLPQLIYNRQQRSFLRIDSPVELLYGATLWYGDTMPTETQLPDLSQWRKPSLFYIPGSIEQFTIADLSAGGIRLFFPKSVTVKHALRLSTLDRFLLMVDLYDPKISSRWHIWLQCKAQRIAPEETNDGFYTGAQFIAWGKPRSPLPADTPGAIEWFRLASSREVEPLSAWIMNRHLDKFRLLDDNNE